MKYSEARYGRAFVLRLEQGDVLHTTIEAFAIEKGIPAAVLVALGGADRGSTLVVGPEDGEARPVHPMQRVLDAPHEIAGVGTLFPGEDGKPLLHMHVAAGRRSDTVTGCVREGVRTWQVAEVIILELLGSNAVRRADPALGFKLLCP